MSKQPEALRLALALELRHGTASFQADAASELRRLHALNVELLEALRRIAEGTAATWVSDEARAAIAKAEA